MNELDKMEQRLARKAGALGVDPKLEGPVGDAVNHAFAQADRVPTRTPSWTSYFESLATKYLERLAEERGARAEGTSADPPQRSV